MRYWWRGFHTHGFRFPPFGFYWHVGPPFPRREQYLRMLEQYRDDLKEELAELEKEIEELKREQGKRE